MKISQWKRNDHDQSCTHHKSSRFPIHQNFQTEHWFRQGSKELHKQEQEQEQRQQRQQRQQLKDNNKTAKTTTTTNTTATTMTTTTSK